MRELEQGETARLDTRTDGGPRVYRDLLDADAFEVERTGGNLYRDEIKRLAELAGLEVTDPETADE